MKWLVRDYVATQGRRLGGQAAAAAVGLGMAQEHESAVAAVVLWAAVSLGEFALSKRSRKKLVQKATEMWGRN